MPGAEVHALERVVERDRARTDDPVDGGSRRTDEDGGLSVGQDGDRGAGPGV